MTALEIVKSKIEYHYHHNPEVFADVRIARPKVELSHDRVKILGVYKNVFRIEEYSTGIPKCHTLSYTDVLTGQFRVVE